jgi:hypothetical protein
MEAMNFFCIPKQPRMPLNYHPVTDGIVFVAIKLDEELVVNITALLQ